MGFSNTEGHSLEQNYEDNNDPRFTTRRGLLSLGVLVLISMCTIFSDQTIQTFQSLQNMMKYKHKSYIAEMSEQKMPTEVHESHHKEIWCWLKHYQTPQRINEMDFSHCTHIFHCCAFAAEEESNFTIPTGVAEVQKIVADKKINAVLGLGGPKMNDKTVQTWSEDSKKCNAAMTQFIEVLHSLSFVGGAIDIRNIISSDSKVIKNVYECFYRALWHESGLLAALVVHSFNLPVYSLETFAKNNLGPYLLSVTPREMDQAEGGSHLAVCPSPERLPFGTDRTVEIEQTLHLFVEALSPEGNTSVTNKALRNTVISVNFLGSEYSFESDISASNGELHPATFNRYICYNEICRKGVRGKMEILQVSEQTGCFVGYNSTSKVWASSFGPNSGSVLREYPMLRGAAIVHLECDDKGGKLCSDQKITLVERVAQLLGSHNQDE